MCLCMWCTSDLYLLQNNHLNKVSPIDKLFVLSLRLCKLKAQPKIYLFPHHTALNATNQNKDDKHTILISMSLFTYT